MTQRLYLIRHGETAWSLSGQHTGTTDQVLTKHGEATAHALGERLRRTVFDHVLVSPRSRAQRTCTLTALPALATTELDLVEWDYGDYEGRRTSEIQHTTPKWSLFRDGCPHGEMPDQISQRADRLIARLLHLSGNIALFTHGHFARALAARWIGLPVGEGRHFFLSPASVSILGFEHRTDRVILQWNHLAGGIPERRRASPVIDRAPAPPPAVDRWENEGGEIPQVYPLHRSLDQTTVASPPPADRWPTAW